MLINAKQLGPTQSIDTDICIIGSGPAGISAALELARCKHRVVMIESGQFDYDASIQKISQAEILESRRHAEMEIATRSQFGGTSSIWGGRCVPFDPVDFETRPHVANSGWPISYAEVASYYERACKLALCGSYEFSTERTFGQNSEKIVPGFVNGNVTADPLERWSLPTDFGQVYEPELASSLLVRIYLGLTCVDLDAETSQIKQVIARSLSGQELKVRARYFIIAAGGLESTRLLMLCDAQYRGKIDGGSETLGRFYMGHVSGKIAQVQFNTLPEKTIFGFERDRQGIYCRRRFCIEKQVQSNEGLLNCALWLDNPAPADARHGNGILSMAYLAMSMPGLSRRLAPEAIRRNMVGNKKTDLIAHLQNIVADLPATAKFIPGFIKQRYFSYRKLPGFFLYNRENRYALHYHSEHAPNRNSRVYLGKQTDSLNRRRLIVDLRFTDLDFNSIIVTHKILDRHLRSLGIGQLDYLNADIYEAIDRQASDGLHQIGTTRMSIKPEHGIVDTDCRVHSLDNLYVASSSVFPTSGQANPTLTIVALSIRLADHLHHKLRQIQG